MIKEKINVIITCLNESADVQQAEKLKYIQSLLESAINYVRAVVTMEARVQILSFRLEPEEYRVAVEQLDQSRRLAHDSFITKLNVVNRICDQLGMEPLYDGPTHRADKGEFAFSIVEEYRINVRG